ncbi:MAG: iron transporter [Bacteroidetes bacterium]|nr:MAG: iron transporter [Bacteroidota bacterium]
MKEFFSVLGPGLVTGASDDDPSGIVTYSQAGAAFGLSTLWTSLLTFPLMTAIQSMCARIGAATSKGLTGVLKAHYPKWILLCVMAFSFPAIILNIGADLQSMGAVMHLIAPKVPTFYFEIIFAVLILYTLINFSYQQISKILKWLCTVLFLYIVIPFLVKVNWVDVIKHLFIPTLKSGKDFFAILVAILGTTISPYLFFWQATMEAEDIANSKSRIVVDKKFLSKIRTDITVGMFFSNLVMFFIILTSGVVLYSAGIHKILTVDQAARSLEPLAGKFSYLLFTMGIIGTGFLAIPVLAGSLSYIVAETFGWREGLQKKISRAPGFYLVIVISLVAGVLLNIFGIQPVQALIYTAILYGMTAPPLIAIILHICNNPRIMGKAVNSKSSNVLGFITLIIMSISAFALIYFQLH